MYYCVVSVLDNDIHPQGRQQQVAGKAIQQGEGGGGVPATARRSGEAGACGHRQEPARPPRARSHHQETPPGHRLWRGLFTCYIYVY